MMIDERIEVYVSNYSNVGDPGFTKDKVRVYRAILSKGCIDLQGEVGDHIIRQSYTLETFKDHYTEVASDEDEESLLLRFLSRVSDVVDSETCLGGFFDAEG